MPQFDRLGNDMSDDIAEALAYEEEKLQAEGNTYYHQEEELTGYEEHLRDSEYQGDARRCPKHPHVKTSSDDGMFDAPCGQCESEEDDAYHYHVWKEELAKTGPVCEGEGSLTLRAGVCQLDFYISCYLTQAAYEEYNLTHLELDEILF